MRRTTRSSGILWKWAAFGGAAMSLFATRGNAADAPVSYHKQIVPILIRSCQGCHNPTKTEGKLDLSSYAAFKAGGRTEPSFAAGKPEDSLLMDFIGGDQPPMPKNADPLPKEEVALFERWIREGANDDTPANSALADIPDRPPVYAAPPVISSLAYSPDGKLLAVAGYHEILIHNADGSGVVARLVGGSPKIESLAFSADGQLLAAAGGAPSRYGEVQLWNVPGHKLVRADRFTNDSLFGVSISPDGQKIAFGGADKSARMISAADGKELLKFDAHSDWVLHTTFNVAGTRLLTGGRDMAMKIVSLANGQFIDDINSPLEMILGMARHPLRDEVVYGGDLGTPRIYRISDNQKRTAGRNDTNLIRAFERQPGSIYSVAYSPDGGMIAVGGRDPNVRVYNAATGAGIATLPGHNGAVFAVAFNPAGGSLATGGYDGQVRLFNPAKGELIKAFVPVEIITPEMFREALGGPAQAAAPKDAKADSVALAQALK